MAFNYINPETSDLLDYLLDNVPESRKQYVMKTLSREYIDMMRKKLMGFNFSMGTLAELNPLLPKELFKGNREVAFLKLDNQKKYSDIGIVMLGTFNEGENVPDGIEMFLAKRDKDKNITLWSSLKDTPGFKDIYRTGNTPYVQRQRIVSGANGDNRGTVVVDMNAYEMKQAVSIFMSNAYKENTREHRLMEAISNDDYSKFNFRSFYKKADRWSTKFNDLVSGKLENVLFTGSQIYDADILSTRTNLGDPYLMKSKLNTEVFEDTSKVFKRASGSNRMDFSQALDFKRKDIYSKIMAGEDVKEFGLDTIASELMEHNLKKFQSNISGTEGLRAIIEHPDAKSVKGDRILKTLRKSNDYLGKGIEIRDSLESLVKDKNTFANTSFSVKTIEGILNRVDKKYKNIEDTLVEKMRGRLQSKIDTVMDPKYKYMLKLTSPENKNSALRLMEKDIIRDFYDKYNEKIDLYEIMRDNRKTSQLTEADYIADMVSFKYDKTGKIIDASLRQPTNRRLNPLRDRKLKWGYYKARNQIGTAKFNTYVLDEQLKLAKDYSEKYSDLYEKHSVKTALGKYDSLEDFKRTQDKVWGKKYLYEMNAGDSISRTSDKIISNINTNNTMDITGSMFLDNSLVKLKIRLDKNDGFDKNDWIKAIQSERQASFKEMDLDVQQFIEKKRGIYNKNYDLQKLITNVQLGFKEDEEKWRELQYMKSFLKGQKGSSERWGIKDGNLVIVDFLEDKTGVEKLTNYNDIYDSITYKLRNDSAYKGRAGYMIPQVIRGKNENMESITDIHKSLFIDRKIRNKLDNTTFMAILNRDQLVNTSGAAKQQGLIHGNTYLSSLGFTLPGLAFNKVTQRTFQAQDLLGERSIDVNGTTKTVSEINAEILNKTGLTGVNVRKGKYLTEEMLKSSINRVNERYGINNVPYMRGETYKTFAIGDVNSAIGDGLNSFTASFQEGMTGTRAMQLTTNAVRNKNFNINLEELDLDKFGYTRKELHELLQTEAGMSSVLEKILDKDLYGTIAGRQKYEKIISDISQDHIKNQLDDTALGMYNFYTSLTNAAGLKHKNFNLRNTEENRMRITNEIMNVLGNLDTTTGMMVKPTTRKGKNVITTDYVKTFNELKPELGFSLKNYKYNPQTRNIELLLENFASSGQGSKGQASGAKFTISEIYDYIKVNDRGQSIFVDAIFNNKAEKRMQTGMMVHGAMQTVFTNVYESGGTRGVSLLAENMSELLNDLGVSVSTNQNGYVIDEEYLTRNARGQVMGAEEFEEMLKNPLDNTAKLFTERGKEILDKVSKKYSSSFYNSDGELVKEGAHFGIINAMQQAYTKTYKELGMKETPFTVSNASVTGYSKGQQTAFGDGSLLLLKFASERVNSNSSKKKESALKVSREMLEMLRTSGYGELSDYMQAKNTRKLSEYLGGVYNSMTNSAILEEIYKHKNDFDIGELNKSMSETITNGVLLNLDGLLKDDYLLNDKVRYLRHSDLMSQSALGQAMVSKGLDEVEDGKLLQNVNVVINDTEINDFTKNLRSSIGRTKEILSKSDNASAKYFLSYMDTLENFDKANKGDLYQIKNRIGSMMDTLDKQAVTSKADARDLYMTKEFLGTIRRNMDNDYSMRQLQSIFKTGNILTSVGLSYDVKETDGTIILNKTLNRIKTIAEKNMELKSYSKNALNFIDKVSKNDKDVVNDIYSGLVQYYSGNTEYKDVELYHNLIEQLSIPNVQGADRLNKLRGQIRSSVSEDLLFRARVENANEFIASYGDKIDLKSSDIVALNESLDEARKTVDTSKKEVLKLLQDKTTENLLKGKISNTIFGKDKMASGNMASFIKNELGTQTRLGFNLLDEYIKVPEEAASLFRKKGPVTSAQKFKINSSFVANPLEGSNLLVKMEGLLFDDVKNYGEFQKNYSELKEFLGSDIVNDRLFTDDEGINLLEELKKSRDSNGFSNGLKKARSIFNKKFADISEVTITEKSFVKSFRGKDHVWKDVFDTADITRDGFTREMAFLSRHPQQTFNHMGGVLNIIVDAKSHDLKNRYARATLTYFPQEKNQAGIITLGKKTMLYRRGD